METRPRSSEPRRQLEDREQPGDAPPDERGHQRPRRRQSRAGTSARASTITRGRQARSGRATPSTTAATANTPASSQSRRPTGGTSVRPRLVPQGAPDVDHGSSLAIGAPRRTGRKNERQTVPSAEGARASGLMCPAPGPAIVDSPTSTTTTGAHDEHTSTHHHHAGRPADPGESQARRGVDELHVPLRLRGRPRLLHARHRRGHPRRPGLRVRPLPDLLDLGAGHVVRPDLHDRGCR